MMLAGVAGEHTERQEAQPPPMDSNCSHQWCQQLLRRCYLLFGPDPHLGRVVRGESPLGGAQLCRHTIPVGAGGQLAAGKGEQACPAC